MSCSVILRKPGWSLHVKPRSSGWHSSDPHWDMWNLSRWYKNKGEVHAQVKLIFFQRHFGVSDPWIVSNTGYQTFLGKCQIGNALGFTGYLFSIETQLFQLCHCSSKLVSQERAGPSVNKMVGKKRWHLAKPWVREHESLVGEGYRDSTTILPWNPLFLLFENHLAKLWHWRLLLGYGSMLGRAGYSKALVLPLDEYLTFDKSLNFSSHSGIICEVGITIVLYVVGVRAEGECKCKLYGMWWSSININLLLMITYPSLKTVLSHFHCLGTKFIRAITL